MNKIGNLKEKRLIVARHIMMQEIDVTDENIISEWCHSFSADKKELNDSELFDWMCRYGSKNTIRTCKEQLRRIRRKDERSLKEKCKHIGHGAKLVEYPKDGLETYCIFTKGKKFSGNYNRLCLRIG